MMWFWISWWMTDEQLPKFELHKPWWISGHRYNEKDAEFSDNSICAAVIARDKADAKRIILEAFDEPRPTEIEWRFCEGPYDHNKLPFSDRFRRADWMQWP